MTSALLEVRLTNGLEDLKGVPMLRFWERHCDLNLQSRDLKRVSLRLSWEASSLWVLSMPWSKLLSERLCTKTSPDTPDGFVLSCFYSHLCKHLQAHNDFEERALSLFCNSEVFSSALNISVLFIADY
jgi:hypothetical protein